MRVEETHFFLHRSLDRDLILDVLLCSVLDSDKAETKLDLLVHNHTLGIGSSVHDVNLGDDTDRSDTLGIDSASHTETFLCGHIGVGGANAKNDCS